MTAKQALSTVVLWGIAFSILGGAMGGTIGTVAPDYYRSVFRDGRSPDFDPFQVGIGLGATQGLAAGVAIALAVLGVLAWRRARAATGARSSPRRWAGLVVWGVATSVAVAVSCTIAFVLGGLIGQQQLYNRWADEKLERIAVILEPGQYPGVRSHGSSAAQVFLVGSVPSDENRSALRDELVLAFGTEEAEEMMRSVEVAE